MDHISIIKVRRPRSNDINEELQWLGASLGLFNLRDKDKSCFRIFIELTKSASKSAGPLTSDEIAYRLNLTRGTVIHHINKLISSGIVEREGNKGYILRAHSMSELVDEIEEDLKRTYENIRKVAKNLDLKLQR
ncbi:MAG: helix-turn-helix domain-containing protein [Nanoarchaeota archaeon]